jgi:hypothetical protein
MLEAIKNEFSEKPDGVLQKRQLMLQLAQELGVLSQDLSKVTLHARKAVEAHWVLFHSELFPQLVIWAKNCHLQSVVCFQLEFPQRQGSVFEPEIKFVPDMSLGFEDSELKNSSDFSFSAKEFGDWISEFSPFLGRSLADWSQCSTFSLLLDKEVSAAFVPFFPMENMVGFFVAQFSSEEHCVFHSFQKETQRVSKIMGEILKKQLFPTSGIPFT